MPISYVDSSDGKRSWPRIMPFGIKVMNRSVHPEPCPEQALGVWKTKTKWMIWRELTVYTTSVKQYRTLFISIAPDPVAVTQVIYLDNENLVIKDKKRLLSVVFLLDSTFQKVPLF